MRALAPAMALLLWTAQVRAGPACAVSLHPEEAPNEWRSAVASLRADLAQATDGDCRAIAVEVSGDRAFVVFTTSDGRQAMRRIEGPADLHPLIDAMLVTIPPAAPAPAQPVATGPSPTRTSESLVGAHVDEMPQLASGGATRLVVGVNGGGRMSTPGGFASPSFGARLGLVFGRWEIAAMGQWDPTHALLGGGAPPGFSMSRYAVGLAAGRQVPLGDTTFALGMTTSIAVVTQEGTDVGSAADQTGGITEAEPLFGAYAGFVWPRRSSLRLRSELSADAVASRLGRTLVIDPALPALPWWSAAATVGVEWVIQ